MQHNTSLNRKIVEVLIVLRDNYGLTSRVIAERLGVKEGTISKVKNDLQSGSVQLLKGLELLTKVAESERVTRLQVLTDKLKAGQITASEKAELLKLIPR